MTLSRCPATTLAVAALLGTGGSAWAQALPTADQFQTKYQFAKAEEVKKVEWKASASAGLTLVTGNANNITFAGGANAVRNDGKNKLTLDLSGVYARAATPVLVTSAGGAATGVSDIDSEAKVTAGYLLGRARYDRFFTANNALYLAAFGGLDIPASKKAIVGVQLGYGRQLIKSGRHELMAEAGIDYNYTGYVAPDGSANLNLNVHVASARLFLGYNLLLGENTRIEAKGESLINLNPTTIGDRRAASADATRVILGVALTTKIWQRLSFRFASSLRYDNCPALNTQVKFAGFAAGTVLAGSATDPSSTFFGCTSTPNFGESRFGALSPADQDFNTRLYQARYNQRLDTLTEANLVFNFL